MAYISKIFVTVDVLIVRPFEMEQQILLIKRKNHPFRDCWALPGGFVDENEDLEQAAIRELVEETQVKASHLEQIGAFGKPDRDPRGHMVSIAYLGKVATNTIAIAADDAKEIGWFSVTNLPSLAFDHSAIIEAGLQKLL
ncbi:MAG: NUDIX domain-containing protein [Flavobacterium sp.]|uniref:NUDIX domain-containing protein n=1 Tax=Flavobacterium sp. TaxID=239 RepID=UPI00378A6888